MAGSSRLLALYEEVDASVAGVLSGHAAAACDPGCADCCRHGPPLVCREEADALQEATANLPPALREEVTRRARDTVRELQQGGRADFPCPLLVEVAGVPRCAVYPARPYACRSFGQTSRPPPEHAPPSAPPVPFTCDRLRPRVQDLPLPRWPFRSEALRQALGTTRLTDSYVPVWIGLLAHEQEERVSGPDRAVVVARVAV